MRIYSYQEGSIFHREWREGVLQVEALRLLSLLKQMQGGGAGGGYICVCIYIYMCVCVSIYMYIYGCNYVYV